MKALLFFWGAPFSFTTFKNQVDHELSKGRLRGCLLVQTPYLGGWSFIDRFVLFDISIHDVVLEPRNATDFSKNVQLCPNRPSIIFY